MVSRVQMIRNCINAHRSQGVNPVELHMTKADVEEFCVEAGIEPEELPDNRSSIQRLMNLGDPPRKVLRFDGLTVVANDKFPRGAMIVRPKVLMSDPNWERFVVFGDRPQPAMPSEGNPWAGPTAPPAEGETSDEIIMRGSGVNPTSVILKAMEGLDKVQDVVVIRFLKNGDIDMGTTMNRYEIMGGLQEAMNYVVRGR